jgi:hypothetical protein
VEAKNHQKSITSMLQGDGETAYGRIFRMLGLKTKEALGRQCLLKVSLGGSPFGGSP